MRNQMQLQFITKCIIYLGNSVKKCIAFFQQTNSAAFQIWFLPSFFVFSE